MSKKHLYLFAGKPDLFVWIYSETTFLFTFFRPSSIWLPVIQTGKFSKGFIKNSLPWWGEKAWRIFGLENSFGRLFCSFFVISILLLAFKDKLNEYADDFQLTESNSFYFLWTLYSTGLFQMVLKFILITWIFHLFLKK